MLFQAEYDGLVLKCKLPHQSWSPVNCASNQINLTQQDIPLLMVKDSPKQAFMMAYNRSSPSVPSTLVTVVVRFV